MSEPGQDPGQGRRRRDRRTLGQTPKPGRIYSSIVGLLFLAVILVGTITTLSNNGDQVLGLDQVDTDLPLAEFAVPVAASNLDGDANVAQDDCEVGRLPCPANDRRTPACEIKVAHSIRVCDYFDRPLIISFWFTRGGDSCELQQDVVSDVSRRYRGRVGFLSIDVRDSRGNVRDLVRSRNWKMPVGFDHDGAVATLYRVGGCPTFVYAYPGGILESASIGELTAAQLAAKADDLLAATRRKERADG